MTESDHMTGQKIRIRRHNSTAVVAAAVQIFFLLQRELNKLRRYDRFCPEKSKISLNYDIFIVLCMH